MIQKFKISILWNIDHHKTHVCSCIYLYSSFCQFHEDQYYVGDIDFKVISAAEN